MTRNKSKKSRPSKVTPPHSMIPWRHDKVSKLLLEEGLVFDFHTQNSDRNATRQYDTHIMGRFECRNPKCSTGGWGSMRIAVTIRMYPGNEYNARVYHQRCKDCEQISRPQVDNSYEDRVAYRIKKWCGIEMDRPAYHAQQDRPPHKTHLCEGCKAGVCPYYDDIY